MMTIGPKEMFQGQVYVTLKALGFGEKEEGRLVRLNKVR